MISKDKWDKLAEWMAKLHINEADFIEKFILGSGSGGQKLHKTASTVYLKHLSSGVEVKCQESRSREDNRYFARERLCEKLQYLFTTMNHVARVQRSETRGLKGYFIHLKSACLE